MVEVEVSKVDVTHAQALTKQPSGTYDPGGKNKVSEFIPSKHETKE